MGSQKVAYEPIAGFDSVVRIPLEGIDDTRIVFQLLQDNVRTGIFRYITRETWTRDYRVSFGLI